MKIDSLQLGYHLIYSVSASVIVGFGSYSSQIMHILF